MTKQEFKGKYESCWIAISGKESFEVVQAFLLKIGFEWMGSGKKRIEYREDINFIEIKRGFIAYRSLYEDLKSDILDECLIYMPYKNIVEDMNNVDEVDYELNPFDKVLVSNDGESWFPTIFAEKMDNRYVTIARESYTYCKPYNN